MTLKASGGMQPPRASVAFARKRPGSLFGIKAVGSFVPALTRKAFERYGFSTASLITDWRMIVGSELAGYTAPERLKWPRTGERPEEGSVAAKGRHGATLVLRVDEARALDVQYQARPIVERINAYFGYAAVADLRILQAPVMSMEAPPARLAARASVAPLTHEVAHVTDPALRGALARLGGGVRDAR